MSRWSAKTGFVTGLGASLLLAGLAISLGGFLSFMALIGDYRAASTRAETADAIVVLTGGNARLAAGMVLLDSQRGQRLLISGVNEHISRKDIRRLVTPAAHAQFDCCVDLGTAARDTLGNGLESARWAAEQDYERILVVTANYHMPRALAEMNRAAPHITWVPHTVDPADVHLWDWWRWPGSARLLISEYVKFLAMQIRFRLDRV